MLNLLIYCVIVYFAIKIIPVQKYLLLLIALMPMTLYQDSSISSDSLIFVLSFLTIAIFLYLSLVKEKIERKNVIKVYLF
ncbi:MAG: DUF2142 domain-containing protein [Methanobrevibacter sp.]|jgi:uncharacterized membrane protein|nr:DUF2142 domain-containing protein [Methanobrevibacter sp.]